MKTDTAAPSPRDLLHRAKLRSTQQRLHVLQAFAAHAGSLTPQKIRQWVQRRGGTIDLATIYRMLDVFEEHGLLHRHQTSGGALLCSLADMQERGHHGFLSCERCGRVQEFHDVALCHAAEKLAARSHFTITKRVNELTGICAACS